MAADSHHFNEEHDPDPEQDLDPHHSEKSDPDLHHNKKRDPDPHQRAADPHPYSVKVL